MCNYIITFKFFFIFRGREIQILFFLEGNHAPINEPNIRVQLYV